MLSIKAATSESIRKVKLHDMGITMIKITCAYCGTIHDKYVGHVNRANKLGLSLYCNKICAGLGRRSNKSIEQKKKEKAEYDKRYSKINVEEKKIKRHEYFKRTYNPEAAAIERKKRMPKHVEYCRQPKYKKWKKEYDKRHRGEKIYGEYAEAAFILFELENNIDNRRQVKVENNIYNKSQKRKRLWTKKQC